MEVLGSVMLSWVFLVHGSVLIWDPLIQVHLLVVGVGGG